MGERGRTREGESRWDGRHGKRGSIKLRGMCRGLTSLRRQHLGQDLEAVRGLIKQMSAI